MARICQIIYDTTTIDLLDETTGYLMTTIEPGEAEMKDGGVWADSKLTDESHLVQGVYGNITTTLTIHFFGDTQNIAISKKAALESVLQKAMAFWLQRYRSKVGYLKLKAADETNARYAVIKSYKFSEAPNPFDRSLEAGASIQYTKCEKAIVSMTLAITHGVWLDNVPGTGTAVEIGNLCQADLVPSGTSVDLDYVYYSDRNVPVSWSANLAGSALPFEFMPAGTGTVYLFLGISETTFASLTFDLKTAITFASPGHDFGWWYHTGSPVAGLWAALSVDDEEVLTKLGVNTVSWTAPGGWTPLNLQSLYGGSAPNVTAYWVFVALVNDYNRTPPEQQNSQIAASEADHYSAIVPTTNAGEVFVANKHTTVTLSHIYIDDGGVFSANLVEETDFNLMPAVPAGGDYVYFGSTVGPFTSLIFDIATACGGNVSSAWETWTGSIWQEMRVDPYIHGFLDATNNDGNGDLQPFSTTGIKAVCWNELIQWEQRAINGVTAWWVRLEIVSASGSPTAPVQQNHTVYTATWPYVEIAASQITGDLPARSKVIAKCESAYDSTVGPYTGDPSSLSLSNLWVGLRSTWRGENFSPFINLSDQLNQYGISVSAGPTNLDKLNPSSATAEFKDDRRSPTGRAIEVIGADIDYDAALVQIGFDEAIAFEYFGSFHAFLRAGASGVFTETANVRAKLAVNFGWTEIAATRFESTVLYDWTRNTIDLGAITIPMSNMLSSEFPHNMSLWITVVCDAEINLYDLILLPTDEWIANVSVGTEFDSIVRNLGSYWDNTPGQEFVIDGIAHQKFLQRAFAKRSNSIVTSLEMNANGDPILQHAEKQRLWFLQSHFLDPKSEEWTISYGGQMMSITIEKQQRYKSLRGSA